MPEKFPSDFFLEERLVARFYHARAVVEVDAAGVDVERETLVRLLAYVTRDAG